MKTLLCAASFFLLFCCAAHSQTKTASASTQLIQQVQALALQGKINEAIVLAERAVELQKTSTGTKSKDYAIALLNLGTLKRLRVERAYKQASDEKPDSKKWAHLREIEKEADKAELLLRQVINIHETDLKTETPLLASALSELAWLLQNTRLPFSQKEQQARSVEIGQLLERALKIRQSQLGESNTPTLKTTADLAEFYLLQGNFEKSLPLFQSYLKNAPKTFGENNVKLVPVLQLYAANLVATDNQTEADEVLKQISAITKKPEEAPKANLTLNERATNLAQMRHPDAISDIEGSRITEVIVKEIREGNRFPTAVKTNVLPVKILVDEQGNVVEAQAETKDGDLRKAAEKAALKSLFKPFTRDGKGRKMRGILKYYYVEVERKR